MFVLQQRIREWDKWTTLYKRYPTYAEAEKALEQMPFRITYRIAEEYTVTRFKAVSDKSRKRVYGCHITK